MKKMLIIVMALAMVFTAVACTGNTPAATEAPAATSAVAAEQPAVETAAPAPEPSYPEKDIKLIIQSSPGGGSDLFARTFTTAVAQNSLLNVTVVPENMPGGSGAVAYAYVADKAGDPYYMLNASGTFITTPVLGYGTDAGKVNYESFTCIAALALDEMIIVVPADSPYQNVTELTSASTTDKPLNGGGTEFGGPDSICYFMLEKETNCLFNYVTFDGGDEVNAALLGHNIDVAIGNPGDFLDLIASGDFRCIGTFADGRIACLPDVPSCTEQGINATYALTRGFVFPGDVPQEAVTVMEEVIKAYMQTDSWKSYIEANSLTEKYMNGEEFTNFCKQSTDMHFELLREMGVITGG